MTTTTIPDVMVCYQCGKRIYRKAGTAVIHLFWNRRPGERSFDLRLSEPGWAHARCAEAAGIYRMERHYQYPWGEPEQGRPAVRTIDSEEGERAWSDEAVAYAASALLVGVPAPLVPVVDEEYRR